ncbi:MAG: DUF4956 domain-containing protein [Spirochaetales bacterium]|nr:MAG: DUF4956 domain-containing protein [Spirochaetales bacterium]
MNALSKIQQMLINPSIQIDITDFILSMLISAVSAFIASVLYQVFYENRATGSRIHRSFLLIGPSVTALFIAIQFSLPLSLGLIGALTIIRFRTPIKEPEEIGFIMLVIAASIVCATFNYLLLIILFGLALIVLILQKFLPRLFKSKRSDGVLLLTLDGGLTTETKERILRLLGDKTLGGSLQSISYTDSLTTFHYSFTGLPLKHLENLESSLKELTPIRKMHIYFNRQGVLI